MSLDRDLRTVLAERAAGYAVPAPDMRVLRAGGLRRRRRRQAIVAMATCLVLVTVAAGLVLALGKRDPRGAFDPVDRPTVRWAVSTRVPWCVDDFLIVGAGPPVTAPAGCRYLAPGQNPHLWYHGGSTVLTTPRDGTYQVADGRLTRMGTGGGGKAAISHDGRYAAWQTDYGPSCLAVSILEVYEVATAEEVATTRIPGVSCSQVAGIDDQGRVYVTVGDERLGDLKVQMYDMGSASWTGIAGLPSGADSFSITYVTAAGFAVETDERVFNGTRSAPHHSELALASVEGDVDTEGHFVRQREVPVGSGLWSPDRSLVLAQRPEGVVVLPANDLTTPTVLDLPVDLFRATATHLPAVNMLWESSQSVLVTAGAPPEPPTYRCDVGNGNCSVVDHQGVPALGSSTQAGG